MKYMLLMQKGFECDVCEEDRVTAYEVVVIDAPDGAIALSKARNLVHGWVGDLPSWANHGIETLELLEVSEETDLMPLLETLKKEREAKLEAARTRSKLEQEKKDYERLKKQFEGQ